MPIASSPCTDAAEKIMKRFELDAEQTDAILELKIYRLTRLEILVIDEATGKITACAANSCTAA
jgi:DNA gyrase subunit A